ncbi:MAG: ATP-binding protein [Pseudomonadota bacterium]
METSAAKEAAELRHETDLRVYGVAHDMQRLMELLQGLSTRIARSLSWEHVAMGIVEIQELARSAEDMACELKTLSGKSSDALQLNRATARMQRLLQTIAGPRLKLRYEGTRDDHSVFLSAVGLEQILINLVTNARNAGADTATIQIDHEPCHSDREHVCHNGFITLLVSDNGCGVSHEQLAELSQLFSFSDEASCYGAGLTTVNNLARTSGGFLELWNQREGGLAAKVSLPNAARTLREVRGARVHTLL